MNLAQAQKYAAHFVQWLAPYCDRIEIAGSIRRERPVCGDVDLVCIPKTEITRDLLGVTGARNLLWEFLRAYVASGKAKFQSGGDQPGKFAILILPKCQLDVYFATESTWGSILIQRTGSKEHNIWLATRARARGREWKPYEGLYDPEENHMAHFREEQDLYAALGLEMIEPKNREYDWLRRNVTAERVAL